MDAKHPDTALQENAGGLPVTDALTQFLPLVAEMDTTSPVSVGESFFGFRVGSLGFLVSSSTHCEVIEQLQVNPLPNVESWFSGLLNLRGNLVPVIDLLVLLAETTGDKKKRQLFAVGQGDRAIAFWVDGLPEIRSISTGALKQLPSLPAILQRSVLGGYFQDGQVWLNVQFDELFKTLGSQYTSEDNVL